MYGIKNDQIIRLVDDATIPAVEGNCDYLLYQQWIEDGNTPQLIEEDIDILKARIAAQIEQYRIVKTSDGVHYKGHLVQTDLGAIQNINAEASAIASGIRHDGEYWRMGDNSLVPLTNAELLEMAVVVRDHVKLMYAMAWGHKDALYALTTATELNEYDWRSGWD